MPHNPDEVTKVRLRFLEKTGLEERADDFLRELELRPKMLWWAVQCRSEPLANLSLGRAGFETYFPHVRVFPHFKKSTTKKLPELVWVRALIPKYLFVCTKADRLHEINNLGPEQGGCKVVQAPGGQPFPIAEPVLDALKVSLASAGGRNPAPTPPAFTGKLGDIVKGKEGWPHWGLVARVVQISGDNVALRMMMFGSHHRRLLAPGRSVEVIKP